MVRGFIFGFGSCRVDLGKVVVEVLAGFVGVVVGFFFWRFRCYYVFFFIKEGCLGVFSCYLRVLGVSYEYGEVWDCFTFFYYGVFILFFVD